MYINNDSLTAIIGEHPHLVLSCHATINERFQFLFLRLMHELNVLSTEAIQIHIYYIDIDDSTGIPTPQVDIVGREPLEFVTLADRYGLLYKQARHYDKSLNRA